MERQLYNLTPTNLQKPMTEVFKVKTGIAPELMKGVFEFTVNLLMYFII